MSVRLPRIFLILLALSLAAPATGKRSKRKHKMSSIKRIVLDAGHGGDNLGTPGAHGKHEKLLTMPIVLELERLLLKKTDAKVTLTRRDDTFVGLRERTRMANAAEADVFLSVHCNASRNASAHGLEVYFLSAEAANEQIAALVADEDHGEAVIVAAPIAPGPAGSRPPGGLEQILEEAKMFKAHEQSQRLAEIVLNTLHRVLRAPRRGVFQAPFGVLKEAEMPAVVVEVGFSTHRVEGKKLTTEKYQKHIARALFAALIELDSQGTGDLQR